MWELVRDLEVAGGLLAELSDHSTRYWRLVEAIDRALDSFDDADPASAATARHQLKDVLDAPAHATAHQVSAVGQDRKSTRLNSSHVAISYAVFCLKKKKTQLIRY